MALDQLLDALTREAAATIERLRTDARTEADRITALSVEVSGRRRQAEVDQVVRRRRAEVETAVSAARHRARDAVLRARERLLRRVDDAVRAAFPAALAAPRYRETLPRRVEAALGCFGGTEVVAARCPAALAEPLLAAWPPDRRGEVRADESLGSGFVVTSGDGAVEVEDTLEARLEARRDEIHRLALHRLGVEG